MKPIRAAAVILSLAWVLVACGYREGVQIPDSRSYLIFSGFTDQVAIVVDGVPFHPGEQVKSTDRYQLQPGEHLVEVQHHGATLVRRRIFFAEGAAREILIPQP